MEETHFQDAENYSGSYGKDAISFKDIILNHLRRISVFASCEFRGGFWEVRLIPVNFGSGTTLKNRNYIPDTREVYSNSVEVFADMLYPYFDKQMNAAESEAVAALKKCFVDKTILVEPTQEGDVEDEPQKSVRTFKNRDDKLSYRDLRVKINRKLFRALCSFLHRKKYLEIGNVED